MSAQCRKKSMNVRDNAHQFAFYSSLVTHIVALGKQQDIHELTDLELLYRITTVLRLQKGEVIVLFNQQFHIVAKILHIKPRQSIALEILYIQPNLQLEPRITWLLPLLKREAFEEALYTLTELGVTAIQPVITAKTHRNWSEKEAARAQKIIIAAAEQSKNFALPTLQPIAMFDIAIRRLEDAILAHKVFFDAHAAKLDIAQLKNAKVQELFVMSGPEGDLTSAEKDQLIAHRFAFNALTPTILRAQQAVAVGLGLLRSLL